MSVTIVTGGSSGIGRAIAARMRKHGPVVITGRNAGHVNEVAEHLGVTAAPGDVRSPEDMVATVSIAAGLGPVTGLIHSAGIWTSGAIDDLTAEEWTDTIDINLSGAFHASRAVLPHLLENGGSIVMIASDFGLVAGRKAAAYVASKFGMVGLTKAMALDLADRGVRVNAICPGDIVTPMLESEAAERGLTLEEALEESAAGYPMRRAGTVAEVAGLAEFLLSNGAGYMTGAAIPVDGGFTAG